MSHDMLQYGVSECTKKWEIDSTSKLHEHNEFKHPWKL